MLHSKSVVFYFNRSESDEKMRSRLSFSVSELDQTNPVVKIRFTRLHFFKMSILISILLIQLVFSTKDLQRHHRVGYTIHHSEDDLKISVSLKFRG